jgi:hypothetical protein
LTSGAERELIRRHGLFDPNISPDGLQIAAVSFDPTRKTRVLLIAPVSGGQPRELLPPGPGVPPAGIQWTPDGRSLVLMGHDGKLWTVPTDGGQPINLNVDASHWNVFDGGGFRFHPDGRQIAFVAGKEEFELWAYRGFLPALTARK